LKIAERENEPSLKIIQNLWTNQPFYELVNEANSKLDKIPSPSYLMFIPSKVYFVNNDGSRVSNLVLSPVSYDVITEQLVENTTKGSIVKSILPKSFFAKKGIRDVIHGKFINIEDKFKVYVDTMPFLVIISDIEFQYNNKISSIVLLSTPLENVEINEDDLNNIKEYTRDNAEKLEVKLAEENSNSYKIAQEKIETVVKEIFNSDKKVDENDLKVLGGKEGGYGFILKKINKQISYLDPMEAYEERIKQN
jgi:hypothetical protein